MSGDELRQISVVYITDNGYAMPTCVSMLSLKSNLDEGCMAKVYVICDGVQDDSAEKMTSLSDDNFLVSMINVKNPSYVKLAESCQSHVSPAALFKFNISNILEKEDKVIYLDGDIIVQDDLEDLYQIDLGENYVAAVDDQLDKIVEGQSAMAAWADICSEHYFNSGVMLFNLKKMREDNVSRKLLDYRENGKNYFMDQDTFNAVMKDSRAVLPYHYNFMATCVEHYDVREMSERFLDGKQRSVNECIDMAKIVHLTGIYKPWKYNIPWFSDLFLKYYMLSPYAQEPIQLKSVMKAMWDTLQSTRDALADADKYIFPYEKIEKNEKIILYGAGKIGKMYYRQIMATGYCDIVGWVDSNYREYEKPVEAPEIVVDREFSKILISIASDRIAKEVQAFLVDVLHVDIKKTIFV